MTAGEVLLGAGADGGREHVVVTGFAACAPLPIPIRNRRRLSLVPADQRCNRTSCRKRWEAQAPSGPVAGADGGHVCPVCDCERDPAATPCPSCGAPYAAEPVS